MSKQVVEVNDNNFSMEVLQAREPVLVDFWAEWCAPCRMMTPVIETLADQYSGRAQVVKVNVDDNPNTAQRFGIKGIPTFIVFKDGKEEERLVGATTQEAIARMIEKHIAAAAA
jgi:thioredoxin 1